MKGLTVASTWLVIIGGLNWGLVAINNEWDLVAKIFGQGDPAGAFAKIIYAIVGLAAIVVLIAQFSGEEK